MNAAVGRAIIGLTGQIDDPRPAYAAADVVVGQGGSALRGMAFGKPVVVVGEDGFSELLTSDSSPIFLQQGWYGLGPGSAGSGVPALRSAPSDCWARMRHVPSSVPSRVALSWIASAFGVPPSCRSGNTLPR